MDFDKAEALCDHAISIHKEHGEEGSLEEAADRRLLALVLSAKGDHEKALENLMLASTTLQANSLEVYTSNTVLLLRRSGIMIDCSSDRLALFLFF